MDFEDASVIGGEGEARVSAELDRLAATGGLRHFDNVCLVVRGKTTQIDHIVIDRYGIVVVETKTTRSGARLYGQFDEARWTAVYTPAKRETIQNPLRQNDTHMNLLRGALKEHGLPVDPDMVRGVIVLDGHQTENLTLDTLSKDRVRRVEELEEYFANRDAFRITSTTWSGEQIIEYAALIRGMDRSNDPAFAQQHAPRAGRKSSGTGTRPAARPPDVTPRVAPPQAGIVDRAVRRQPRAGRVVGGCISMLVQMALLAVLVAIIAIWAWWSGLLGPILSRTTPPTAAISPSPDSVNVAAAQALLQQYCPDQYPKVANLQNPQVDIRGDGTADYTWEYVEAKGATARVRLVTIRMRHDGTFAGLTLQRQ